MIPLGVLASSHYGDTWTPASASGLVQWYELNNPDSYSGSGSAVYDLNSTANDAVLYNSPTYVDQYLSLGRNQSINNSTVLYNTQFTVSALMYVTDLSGDPNFGSTIWGSSSGIGGSGTRGSWVYHKDGKVVVEPFNSTPVYTTPSAVVPLNEWVVISVSAIKGGPGAVYANESKIGTFMSGTMNAQQSTFNDLRPDRNLGGVCRFGAGLLYDVALTDEQILSNHQYLLNTRGL